jgi:ribose/xylose/arabinose/galactoside ABC-type transport system permease subunit
MSDNREAREAVAEAANEELPAALPTGPEPGTGGGMRRTRHMSSGGRRPRNMQVVGVYVAILLMWVGMTILSPNFLTVQNIRSLLVSTSTLSIIAAGLAIVLIAGEVDLSFANLQGLAGAISAVLIIQADVPWPLGILLAVACAGLAGLISGLVSVLGGLSTFITTLAMYSIAQGTAFLLTNGQPVAFFPADYQVIGSGSLGPVPYSIVVPLVIYAILGFVLLRTPFGIHVFAVGGNRSAARRVGINCDRTIVAVMTLSGVLAGIAGIVITSRLNSGSGAYGAPDLLLVYAGVIIGGASLSGGSGSLAGAFGGILIIVTISDSLTILNVSPFWQQVLVGVIILAAAMTREAASGGSPRTLVTRVLSSRRPGGNPHGHGTVGA